MIEDQELRSCFSTISGFGRLTAVQRACMPYLLESDDNCVISAPTGSGKTLLLEMAIIRRLYMEKKGAPCEFGLPRQQGCKVVYIAPLRALVHEKAVAWREKFDPLGWRVVELTGEVTQEQLQLTGGRIAALRREIANSKIFVCTAEKWFHISKHQSEVPELHQIGLILVDEIHTVALPGRGAVLEAVIARHTFLHNHARHRVNLPEAIIEAKDRYPLLRLIAISASIPNVYDIGRWMGEGHSLVFGPEFRPLGLDTIVYSKPVKGATQNLEMLFLKAIPNVIEEHSFGRPTIIFCPTRKGALFAAKNFSITKNTVREIVGKRCATILANHETKPDVVLQALLSNGVAVHHGSLEKDQRLLVEQLFLTGNIYALFSTSTLAMGVNLPAHLVIINSTAAYKGDGYEEYDELEMVQMCGRAGRPGMNMPLTDIEKSEAKTKSLTEDDEEPGDLVYHHSSEAGTFNDVEVIPKSGYTVVKCNRAQARESYLQQLAEASNIQVEESVTFAENVMYDKTKYYTYGKRKKYSSNNEKIVTCLEKQNLDIIQNTNISNTVQQKKMSNLEPNRCNTVQQKKMSNLEPNSCNTVQQKKMSNLEHIYKNNCIKKSIDNNELNMKVNLISNYLQFYKCKPTYFKPINFNYNQNTKSIYVKIKPKKKMTSSLKSLKADINLNCSNLAKKKFIRHNFAMDDEYGDTIVIRGRVGVVSKAVNYEHTGFPDTRDMTKSTNLDIFDDSRFEVKKANDILDPIDPKEYVSDYRKGQLGQLHTFSAPNEAVKPIEGVRGACVILTTEEQAKRWSTFFQATTRVESQFTAHSVQLTQHEVSYGMLRSFEDYIHWLRGTFYVTVLLNGSRHDLIRLATYARSILRQLVETGLCRVCAKSEAMESLLKPPGLTGGVEDVRVQCSPEICKKPQGKGVKKKGKGPTKGTVTAFAEKLKSIAKNKQLSQSDYLNTRPTFSDFSNDSVFLNKLKNSKITRPTILSKDSTSKIKEKKIYNKDLRYNSFSKNKNIRYNSYNKYMKQNNIYIKNYTEFPVTTKTKINFSNLRAIRKLSSNIIMNQDSLNLELYKPIRFKKNELYKTNYELDISKHHLCHKNDSYKINNEVTNLFESNLLKPLNGKLCTNNEIFNLDEKLSMKKNKTFITNENNCSDIRDEDVRDMNTETINKVYDTTNMNTETINKVYDTTDMRDMNTETINKVYDTTDMRDMNTETINKVYDTTDMIIKKLSNSNTEENFDFLKQDELEYVLETSVSLNESINVQTTAQELCVSRLLKERNNMFPSKNDLFIYKKNEKSLDLKTKNIISNSKLINRLKIESLNPKNNWKKPKFMKYSTPTSYNTKTLNKNINKDSKNKNYSLKKTNKMITNSNIEKKSLRSNYTLFSRYNYMNKKCNNFKKTNISKYNKKEFGICDIITKASPMNISSLTEDYLYNDINNCDIKDFKINNSTNKGNYYSLPIAVIRRIKNKIRESVIFESKLLQRKKGYLNEISLLNNSVTKHNKSITKKRKYPYDSIMRLRFASQSNNISNKKITRCKSLYNKKSRESYKQPNMLIQDFKRNTNIYKNNESINENKTSNLLTQNYNKIKNFKKDINKKNQDSIIFEKNCHFASEEEDYIDISQLKELTEESTTNQAFGTDFLNNAIDININSSITPEVQELINTERDAIRIITLLPHIHHALGESRDKMLLELESLSPFTLEKIIEVLLPESPNILQMSSADANKLLDLSSLLNPVKLSSPNQKKIHNGAISLTKSIMKSGINKALINHPVLTNVYFVPTRLGNIMCRWNVDIATMDAFTTFLTDSEPLEGAIVSGDAPIIKFEPTEDQIYHIFITELGVTIDDVHALCACDPEQVQELERKAIAILKKRQQLGEPMVDNTFNPLKPEVELQLPPIDSSYYTNSIDKPRSFVPLVAVDSSHPKFNSPEQTFNFAYKDITKNQKFNTSDYLKLLDNIRDIKEKSIIKKIDSNICDDMINLKCNYKQSLKYSLNTYRNSLFNNQVNNKNIFLSDENIETNTNDQDSDQMEVDDFCNSAIETPIPNFLITILNILSHASCLEEDLRVRAGDKFFLRSGSDVCRFPIKSSNKVESRTKAIILLQVYLACQGNCGKLASNSAPDADEGNEMATLLKSMTAGEIAQDTEKLVRKCSASLLGCLKELGEHLHRGDVQVGSVMLARCLKTKMWEVSANSFLRQIPGVGSSICKKFLAFISFDVKNSTSYWSMIAEKISQRLENPKDDSVMWNVAQAALTIQSLVPEEMRIAARKSAKRGLSSIPVVIKASFSQVDVEAIKLKVLARGARLQKNPSQHWIVCVLGYPDWKILSWKRTQRRLYTQKKKIIPHDLVPLNVDYNGEVPVFRHSLYNDHEFKLVYLLLICEELHGLDHIYCFEAPERDLIETTIPPCTT